MSITKTEPAQKHSIVLDFEDPDTLLQALEYLGESDAPVCLIDDTSQVIVGNITYKLWAGYAAAVAALSS